MDAMRATGLALAAAVAWLLAPPPVRPDSLGFSGDEPAFPHVWLDLTPAQRKAVAAAHPVGDKWPWPEIRLTARQRALLREQVEADVPWLFAVDRATATSGCSCGAYNLGLVVGRRLAVLTRDLGDYLAPGDVPGLERELVDRRLAGPPPAGATRAWLAEWRPASEAPGFRRAAERYPAESFERRLDLRDRWRAQRVRLAALPRVRHGHETDAGLELATPSRIGAEPVRLAAIEWPRHGARFQAEDGSVFYLVPGVVEPELGPWSRAWVILEYRGGRIASFAALTEYGTWTGATYAWPSGGGP